MQPLPPTRTANRSGGPARARRGGVLVEFALIALVFYLLVAAVLTFGLMLYAAQGSQQAVDTLARELSRSELPAEATLEYALHGDARADSALAEFRAAVFDEHYLVLNLDTLHGRPTLADLVADLPLVNRQLVPLMQFDTVGGVRYLRYPGALYQDANGSDDPLDPPAAGLLVAVPLVVGRNGDGVETIRWVRPFEEIPVEGESGFPLSSGARGVVSLRMNYPAQSPAMTGHRATPGAPFEPNVAEVLQADDSAVTILGGGFAPGGPLVASDFEYGPSAGVYGLGRQAAQAREVRPFRRVLTSQAVYRREIFGE